MSNKLFVGNLAFSVTDASLSELFGSYGQVITSNIATDRDSGRSRGFGFVEMKTQEDAEKAIAGLNGHEIAGRTISVSVSQPKPRKSFG